jgi:hypothetical protein
MVFLDFYFNVLIIKWNNSFQEKDEIITNEIIIKEL